MRREINRRRSEVRARVEHVTGVMKRISERARQTGRVP